MKGKNKQLVGLFGLGLVLATTAVAYSLPAPEAAAQDVNISVTVTAEAGSARIISPEHGSTLTSRTVPVSVSYNKIQSVTTTVTCKDKDGEQAYTDTKTHNGLTTVSGVVSDVFTLPENYTELSCTAAMTSRGLDGLPYDETISFFFRSMNLPNAGTEDKPNKPSTDPNVPSEGFDDKNNPEVEVEVDDDVQTVTVQVYDMDDNPIFVDKDGKETPIVVDKDAFKDGKVTIKLPMSEYNAKPGKYVAYFIARNSKGEVISVNEYWFEYWPVESGDPSGPSVETPGTGSIFKDMNLSRADYLVTGLVAFSAVAIFATYLVFRRSRR